MNKEEFQRYLETKKQLTKEFKNIDALEEKYKVVKATKDKLNEYHKSYHKDMMDNDPDYVNKRKEFNKKSYAKYKLTHPTTIKQNCQSCKKLNDKPVDKPIDKPVDKLEIKPEDKPVINRITLDNFNNQLGF